MTSKAEAMLALHLRAHKIAFEAEYRFAPPRKWRFDFVIEKQYATTCLAVEIDGGNRMAAIGKNGKPFAIGRHTLRGDYDKLNHAAINGWRVLRFTPAMVADATAINTILLALGRT